jgi:hypothetical protein
MRGLMAAVTIVMCLAAPAAAEGPDILQIFDRFVISKAAAEKCLKPSQDTAAKFLVNFQGVTIRAVMRLKEMYPNSPQEKIEAGVKGRMDELSTKTAALVEKEGCGGENTANLLKLFDFHANWDMYGKGKQ